MAKAVKYRFIKRIFRVFFLSFLVTASFAQQSPLNKCISLHVKNRTVQDVLTQIESKGNFNFSYNTAILDNLQPVSLQVEHETIASILKKILGKKIEYKVIGDHVVLVDKYRNKSHNSHYETYQISGYILDATTGKKLYSATIYDIDGMNTGLTDANGYYSISLPANKEFCEISYCKQGYRDTVIIIKPAEIQNINVQLKPKLTLNKIPGKKVTALPPHSFNEQPLIQMAVPSEMLSHADNLKIYEQRIGQVSILPIAGAHTSINGALINNVSLNILAGFSGGVNGVEIGGLLNADNNFINGCQVAGLGNIVGEKTTGVQLAGLFNINTGSITGCQIAGLSNVVNDTIKGVQVAGLFNTLRGKMKGVQIAGLYNLTTKNVDGMQISGCFNLAFGNAHGGQITGLANLSAKSVNGLQIAGLINFAADTNSGIQISGLINAAKTMKGLQVGVLNLSDTSSGYAIGLVNFVWKGGYRAIEVGTGQNFYGNFTYKMGIRKFYNVYNVDIDQKVWSFGLGFGSCFRLSNHFTMSLDASSNTVNETNKLWENKLILLNRLSLSLDYRPFSHFVLFAAPTYNVYISPSKSSIDYSATSDIAGHFFYNSATTNTQTQMWFGWKVGVRILLSKK